jgi:hypothetical protein
MIYGKGEPPTPPGRDPVMDLEAILEETKRDPTRIVKVSYTHDAMINLIIAQPAISQNEIAAHFGYTASWVSNIIQSDAFQARLAERVSELVDPQIRQSVELQYKGLVARSLEILAHKLNGPAHTISDNLALRALDIAGRAAGYGARPPEVQTNTQVNVHLEGLAENMVKLLEKAKEKVA